MGLYQRTSMNCHGQQTYQTVVPQFLLLRSILLGVKEISFWMLTTGRALDIKRSVSISVEDQQKTRLMH